MRLRQSLLTGLIWSATSLLPLRADAAVYSFVAALSGPAESPPNASSGIGDARLRIDDVAKTITIEAAFSGLTGTTTAAHIHCCTAAAGAGTAGVATVTPSFTGFPLGVTFGSYARTYDATATTGTWNAAFVTANGGTVDGAFTAFLAGLLAGKAYFNIHTTAFTAGEIRGFLVQTPLPGALFLFAPALGFIITRRKRAA